MWICTDGDGGNEARGTGGGRGGGGGGRGSPPMSTAMSPLSVGGAVRAAAGGHSSPPPAGALGSEGAGRSILRISSDLGSGGRPPPTASSAAVLSDLCFSLRDRTPPADSGRFSILADRPFCSSLSALDDDCLPSLLECLGKTNVFLEAGPLATPGFRPEGEFRSPSLELGARLPPLGLDDDDRDLVLLMVSLIPSEDGLTVNSVFRPSFPTPSLAAASSAVASVLFSLLMTSFNRPVLRERPGDLDSAVADRSPPPPPPPPPLPGDGVGREPEPSLSRSVRGRCDLALSLPLLSRLRLLDELLDLNDWCDGESDGRLGFPELGGFGEELCFGLALGCFGDEECFGETVKWLCFDDDDDDDLDLGTGLDDFPVEEAEPYGLFGELPALDECFLGGGEVPCFMAMGFPPPSRPRSRSLPGVCRLPGDSSRRRFFSDRSLSLRSFLRSSGRLLGIGVMVSEGGMLGWPPPGNENSSALLSTARGDVSWAGRRARSRSICRTVASILSISEGAAGGGGGGGGGGLSERPLDGSRVLSAGERADRGDGVGAGLGVATAAGVLDALAAAGEVVVAVAGAAPGHRPCSWLSPNGGYVENPSAEPESAAALPALLPSAVSAGISVVPAAGTAGPGFLSRRPSAAPRRRFTRARIVTGMERHLPEGEVSQRCYQTATANPAPDPSIGPAAGERTDWDSDTRDRLYRSTHRNCPRTKHYTYKNKARQR